MSNQTKYVDGYASLNIKIHIQQKRKLYEYIEKTRMNQTEVMESALTLLFSPDLDERLELQRKNKCLEAELKQVKAELEKERSYKKEIKQALELPNVEATRILNETKDMLAKGKLSAKGLSFRCENLLRPFLKDKSISKKQKNEIIEFINHANSKGETVDTPSGPVSSIQSGARNQEGDD